jgi:hypothetical protein
MDKDTIYNEDCFETFKRIDEAKSKPSFGI